MGVEFTQQLVRGFLVPALDADGETWIDVDRAPAAQRVEQCDWVRDFGESVGSRPIADAVDRSKIDVGNLRAGVAAEYVPVPMHRLEARDLA